MNSALDYIGKAQEFRNKSLPEEEGKPRVAIVTNFTDDILEKILLGMCIDENIFPNIYRVPFQQYQFELKDEGSILWNFNADITFFFFDIHEYQASAFTIDEEHFENVYQDIQKYAEKTTGLSIIHAIPLLESRQSERIFRDSTTLSNISKWNDRLKILSKERSNVFYITTDKLFQRHDGAKIRDLRGLYAFSQPFQTDFLLEVAREWISYIRVLTGKIKKCIVVDLDNTLWGGVLGDLGATGIALGHEYPGNAYLEFQRTLLNFYEQGILLAINSRNNMHDVLEVFEKNQNMLLKEDHFASIQANWNDKATNLRTIAEELNIGLESMVFLDDDPMNRDLVQLQLPEVYVPDFSLRPEEYVYTLLDLDIFHGYGQVDEDKERGRMYTSEKKRKELHNTIKTISEYIATLNIHLKIMVNKTETIPRLAQLTQKTNQYNLTTYRSTEPEIEKWMREGSFIFAGEVADRFGPYGISVMAIVCPISPKVASLQIFLMSCRVAGRYIEQSFFAAIVKYLHEQGYETLCCTYIPTTKNIPVKDFLINEGLTEVEKTENGAYTGVIRLGDDNTKEAPITKLITTVYE